MLAVKVLGAMLALAGLLLAMLPGLLVELSSGKDRFAAIETRTRFGAMGGLGVGLSILEAFSPWNYALAYLAFWTTIGFFAARVVGLLLDGYHPKQIKWLAVEIFAAACLAYYLWG